MSASGPHWDPREGRYTRLVSPEEQALVEKLADKMIPLCTVRGCEKFAGHDDEHGPIQLAFEPVRFGDATASQIGEQQLEQHP